MNKNGRINPAGVHFRGPEGFRWFILPSNKKKAEQIKIKAKPIVSIKNEWQTNNVDAFEE